MGAILSTPSIPQGCDVRACEKGKQEEQGTIYIYIYSDDWVNRKNMIGGKKQGHLYFYI